MADPGAHSRAARSDRGPRTRGGLNCPLPLVAAFPGLSQQDRRQQTSFSSSPNPTRVSQTPTAIEVTKPHTASATTSPPRRKGAVRGQARVCTCTSGGSNHSIRFSRHNEIPPRTAPLPGAAPALATGWRFNSPHGCAINASPDAQDTMIRCQVRRVSRHVPRISCKASHRTAQAAPDAGPVARAFSGSQAGVTLNVAGWFYT